MTMDLYEQKYKDALGKLQEAFAPEEDGCKISGLTRGCLENIFPELKEPEDESIRKILMHIVKGACSKYGIKYQGDKIGEEKLLAWLEKQGHMLDPDKVIEWLENKQPSVGVYEKFKKDFGL